MIPTGKKIITYNFKKDEGTTLSIKNDKVYCLYPTVNPTNCGRTLIASGIKQILIYTKRKNEIPEIGYRFDYYDLVVYFENIKNNKIFCTFEVEEVKINPYMGIMYVYLK